MTEPDDDYGWTAPAIDAALDAFYDGCPTTARDRRGMAAAISAAVEMEWRSVAHQTAVRDGIRWTIPVPGPGDYLPCPTRHRRR